jgi:Family of unknown function (DUF5309)
MAEFVSPDAFDLPDVNKAIDTTERSLLRQDLEAVITKVDMKGTPLRKRWPRVRANGLTHEYTQRTSLGSPTSSFYPDGQLPNDGTTRYLRKGKQIKCIGEMGRVTGLMIAAGRSFADQLALEQQARMVSVLQAEEGALLTGDTTKGTVVTNSDGTQTVQYLQFDGLRRVLSQESGIVFDSSAFAGGAKISIPLVNTVIQNIYDNLGEPTAIVVGSREKRFFNELLQSFVRYNGDGVVHVERQLGVSVMYYDSDFGSLPILPTRYIQPDDGQLTEAYVLCEKTAGENIIEVAELQSIGSQPLAKIDDSERFMVNEYQTLVVRAPQWNANIQKLSA